MAYQNVGTPRFYVDHIQYLKATNFDFISHYNNTYYTDQNEGNGDGVGYGVEASDWLLGNTYTEYPNIFTLEASKQKNLGWTGGAPGSDDTSPYRTFFVPASGAGLEGDNIGRYTAVLNHNASGKLRVIYDHMRNQTLDNTGWTSNDVSDTRTEILNNATDSHQSGTTIFTVESTKAHFAPDNNNICYSRIVFNTRDENDDSDDKTFDDFAIGGLSTGIYYDMPHSPDLKLTMDVEYDGYDTVTTKGGSTLTNIRYQGSPWWIDEDGNKYAPFQVGTVGSGDDDSQFSQGGYRRNGRRVWNLKFSYISDKDLFASNYMQTTHLETDTGYDSADADTDRNVFNYTIDSDNSFMSLVWQKTLGGALPFIFQPDNTNNNPDQFCIARFDQKSLRISQVANSVYNINVKIIETW